MRPLPLLALLAAPLPATAQGLAATCDWARLSPSAAYSGPCTVEPRDHGARVSFGARDLDIRERSRNGPWSDVTLNGSQALRLDLDGSRSSLATLDLNETLDLRLQQ